MIRSTASVVGATLVVAPSVGGRDANWQLQGRAAIKVGATTRVAPTAGNVGGRRLWAPLQRYDFGRRFNPFRLADAIDYPAPLAAAARVEARSFAACTSGGHRLSS